MFFATIHTPVKSYMFDKNLMHTQSINIFAAKIIVVNCYRRIDSAKELKELPEVDTVNFFNFIDKELNA